MKTKDIIESLRNKYQPPEWAFFSELRAGTGYNSRKKKRNPEQRFDAWALNCWPSKGFVSIAFEVKISRSDFLAELKNPKKRKQAMDFSCEFYFVTPLKLVKLDEIPEDCGWITVNETGVARVRKKSPRNEKPSLEWGFFASVARRNTEISEHKYQEMQQTISRLQNRIGSMDKESRKWQRKWNEYQATIRILERQLRKKEGNHV